MDKSAKTTLEDSTLTATAILQIFDRLKKEAQDDDVFIEDAKMVDYQLANRGIGGQGLLSGLQQLQSLYVQTPVVTYQILPHLIHGFASIMTKARQTVSAVPATSSLESAMAAETATKAIEYLETEEQLAKKWHRTAIYAAQHGTGYMHIIFDEKIDKMSWQPLSIFDVMVENRNSFDDVQWCMIRSYMKRYEAEKMMEAAGLSPDVTLVEYDDAAGVKRKGVECFRLYIKPDSLAGDDGLYATIIGEAVCESKVFPYTFDEVDGKKKSILPVFPWVCRSTRDTTLGTTWALDCVPIQASISRLLSTNVDNCLNEKLILKMPDSLKNKKMTNADNSILYFSPNDAQSIDQIGYIEVPQISQANQITFKTLVDAIYMTAGMSPSSLGQDSNQSGKALQFQSELDADKHADAFKSLEQATAQAWEFALLLLRDFYPDEIVMKITGEDPLTFNAKDIAGVNIRLEPAQARDQNKAVKLEKIKEDMASGFADRSVLLDQAPTPITAGMASWADDYIEQYIAGEPVDIDTVGKDMIPPEIFLNQLDKARRKYLLKNDKTTIIEIDRLKKEYLQLVAKGEQSSADQAPAPSAEAPGTGPLQEYGSLADEEPMPMPGV